MIPKCLTADANLFRRRPVILLQPLLNSWTAIIAAGNLPLLLSDIGRRGK
jgi:hypothetical protein